MGRNNIRPRVTITTPTTYLTTNMKVAACLLLVVLSLVVCSEAARFAGKRARFSPYKRDSEPGIRGLGDEELLKSLIESLRPAYPSRGAAGQESEGAEDKAAGFMYQPPRVEINGESHQQTWSLLYGSNKL